MILLLDNYDSFTHILADYLRQIGLSIEVHRNDQIDLSAALQYDGIVLSPGPGHPSRAGIMNELLAQLPVGRPALGVCLGMQAMGLLGGMALTVLPEPVHGKTSMIQHSEHPLFAGLNPELEVMRYHSLVLEPRPGDQVEVIATTSDGEVMAIALRDRAAWGVQFHPESILTHPGIQILRNWAAHHNFL